MKSRRESATWVIDTSGITNPVKYLLITRFNGNIVSFNKGTLDPARQSLSLSRGFGDTDIGSWYVEAVFQDQVTGAHYSNIGPGIGVTKNDF